jgi:diguanylate cyclase (GGDEF)-like protein
VTHADWVDVVPEADDVYQESRRAFECDLPGSLEHFAALLEEAERQGYRKTASSALYGMVRHTDESGGDALPIIERLRQLAEEDGDDATVALALAWRAWAWVMRDDAAHLASASLDLARATVMLETTVGDEVVRASAHLRLAFSYLNRRLWELADEQYSAAAAMVDTVDPLGKDPLLHRAALAYNRVMVQIDWGCGLRLVGDLDGLAQRRAHFASALEETSVIDMPEEWRRELRLAGLAMGALAGEDVADAALAALADPNGPESWSGLLHLAVALCPDTVGLDQAIEACETAVSELGGGDEPSQHDVAIYQAAVLEALAAGRTTAGLRAVQRYAVQRDSDRSGALLSMRFLIASERLRAEHDLLSQHAYLDHLTGMANRRALDRYLDDLRARGVEDAAMLVIDVDHFKAVNDRFGHGVGDEVLRRLGTIFAASVRTEDLAARIGGDEFVVVMARSTSAAAKERAEAIVRGVAETPWGQIAPALGVSISIGVAADRLERVDALAARADAALYRAKEVMGTVAESL